jgi:hypothetical protein
VTLVSRIAELVRTNSIDRSDRLVDAYFTSEPGVQETIDEVFSLLCGFSLATLIEEAQLTDSTEALRE